MKPAATIGEYLISRLCAHGAGHVFGIPGDYVLGFYEMLQHSDLKLVTTCDEQGAGFAADAYARVRGLGVVCVTYCVGGLKLANATACAYAEKSPVVVISGAPGMKEREKNPLLHHKVREFDTQKKVFEQLTVASTVLGDPQAAFQEIDRVLNAALRYKRPVYIELPRDMVNAEGIAHHQPAELHAQSDPDVLREAVREAAEMIKAARQPVILVDVEVHRFGLQEEVLRLLEKTGIPFATTILGKSVIPEGHPLFLGVYEGAMGRAGVRDYVESSDCLVMLGTFMTDINLGIYTAHLDPARAINATSEKLSIRHHNFEEVRFKDFLRALIDADIPRPQNTTMPPQENHKAFQIEPGAKITVKRLFERLGSFLSDSTIVITDVGDALFGAADLPIRRKTEFLGPAYYASMGFAAPAAIGAEIADPKLRPLVIVGDGAFQMTGMELSTAVRHGLKPIVVLLNNGGYGTERHMRDGPYNDVLRWQYSRLPEVLGAGKGFIVETEAHLETALADALAYTESFSLIEVRLDSLDRSAALERLANGLAKRL